jgi:hypothetical protein
MINQFLIEIKRVRGLRLWCLMALSMSVTCNRSVVSSTNKTDCHNITEILLKVALNTIALIP